MTGFLSAHGAELAGLALEHLGLVAVTMAIAIALAVPTGVLISRRPRLAGPVLGAASVAQTIPSLALFGFLIPLDWRLGELRLLGGIGAGTAVTALVIYALLPILRNTYTGLRGVDPALLEAGTALGMTPSQRLFGLELPLATGPIVAGIRTATVLTVAMATIAAAIDAGGLGKYIFRGLRMNDNGLILAGALTSAAIALGADALFGLLERAIAKRRPRPRAVSPRRRLALALGATAVVALGVGLFGAFGRPASGRPPVAIGAKDFTEQLILGELLAQEVEARGEAVLRRFDLGGSLAHEALVAGEIDAYVEYTGTALLAILKAPMLTDPAAVYAKVKEAYRDRYEATWGRPLGFDNTFAILVRSQDAKALKLRTVSDVARRAPRRWVLGFGQDFMSRPDGYAGFAKAYGLRPAAPPREMELALTYRALADGSVDLIAGNATDGLIARYGLTQLVDDRRYFPPYAAAPVARRASLTAHPALAEAIEALAGKVSAETMRALNDAVDNQHQSAREVVADFRLRSGLAAGS